MCPQQIATQQIFFTPALELALEVELEVELVGAFVLHRRQAAGPGAFWNSDLALCTVRCAVCPVQCAP